MPEVGVEPTRLAAREFESRVSAVPPLRRLHTEYKLSGAWRQPFAMRLRTDNRKHDQRKNRQTDESFRPAWAVYTYERGSSGGMREAGVLFEKSLLTDLDGS